ncbi:3-oxoacyl-[acyl-carrier-protein] synthase III C-terminal domain-containing protein [Streptomyces sp. NPDC048312]|uniref:3-oxoacyl-(Acyl-carrier-protein (Acp)) synthase III domain-containing protein n=1 Tax=Streptomyces melanovinaceus TaxID=1182637 RepID=A0A060P175_9ACTN|nr:3-oxoacyl-(acyl-carrier-protein (acp)) synthase III domain-containing protein [Streptomyces melanovinaceus]
MKPGPHFGLLSLGAAHGERVAVADIVSEYTADTQRVLEYGYRNIHRCPPDVSLCDLAEEAAREALAMADITADQLDLLVLAITDIPEYLYWDPSTHVQHRLGARRAETVLIAQGCIGGITCLDQVAGRFATHPDYQNALVIGVNRTCEAYWNRMETHSLMFSDGAAAAVLRRGHDAYTWRAVETISDGRYSDFFLLEQGGAAVPFTADGAETGMSPTVRDAWDMMEFFDYDTDRFATFVDLMNTRVAEVVARACRRIGADVSDLSRVVFLNDNARTLKDVSGKIGVPLDRTNFDISLEHGHFGAADHLFNLRRHILDDAVKPGDLIALAGMGRGMHWACALIEV